MLTTRVYYQLNSPTGSAFPRSVLRPHRLSISHRLFLQIAPLLACRLRPNAAATYPQMRLSLQGVLELPGLPWALLAASVPGSLLLILKRRSLLLMMLDNQRVSPLPSPPPPLPTSLSQYFQKETGISNLAVFFLNEPVAFLVGLDDWVVSTVAKKSCQFLTAINLS